MVSLHASSPKSFQAERYYLTVTSNESDYLKLHLLITGRKFDRPSKRITLHQRGIKIYKATVSHERKNILYHHSVSRINHIKSFEQVRIHTAESLYPGKYDIELQFTSNMPLSAYQLLSKQGLQSIGDEIPFDYFPTVDRAKARDIVNFEISYTDGKNSSGV